MNILFAGTGDIALPSFQALLDSSHTVVGLVTQPDKPVGRKQILTPPAIKTVADKAGIPVFQPERLRKPSAVERVQTFDADIIVVMAYGQILSKKVLNAPKIACLNLHASILPKYRGASPIQAALREGDSETGITVMHMDVGLDTGDILLIEKLAITKEETGQSLHDRLADLAPHAMLKAIGQLEDGSAPRTPQRNEDATEVHKLERSDGQIDWTLPGAALERLVRAYDPWPGTYTLLEDAPLKIYPQTALEPTPDPTAQPGQILEARRDSLLIQTGSADALVVREVQQSGRKRLPVQAFLSGNPLEPGTRFAF